MSDFVDRYTPSEPYPRLIVPIALTTTFLSLFVLFTLTAFNQYGPITDVHVSYLAIPFGMFLALLASVRVAHVAVRDVANRASTGADRSTSADGIETAEDGTDPVSILQRRYAAGELTETEFERKVDRILETDRSVGANDAERLVE